ncbi:MAG TPA: cytochrome c biogenesis protein CcsA, partial [Phycisphaerae bacterium]|nr:cytochrome c biogenesis protein CcsA [Phycisphaerae bacterium]
LMLLGWTFDPQGWMHEPLISIANAELRRELQLPASQTVLSYEELLGHAHLMKLMRDLTRIERGRKMNPLESKVSDISNKLGTLQDVFNGQSIRPIPDADDPLGFWRPIRMPQGEEAEAGDSVQGAWAAAQKAFLADDAPAFSSACNRLVSSLKALPAAHRPDSKRIDVELLYNRIQPFRTAWMVMMVGAVLALWAMLVRRRWFDVLAVLGLVAGFGMLTYGLWLRWQIAGRIPAANMFESLLFLSWGMGAFAILAMLGIRRRVVPLTASAMGALALVLADVLPLDPYVRPILPVLLGTVWMSIHVPVIMVSYSVLALAVLIAHAQVTVMAVAPSRRGLSEAIDSLHYWYVLVGSILLLAGIVTGSMWAASSWGRYWGWDPKEVWSLIAFLGYMAILHVRVDHDRVRPWAYVVAGLLAVALFVIVVPKLMPLSTGKLLGLGGAVGGMVLFVLARGKFATAVKSIMAFWLIIMTYVGVNYVLGSELHSYGFGTGAVVRSMFLVGGIDLGLVALCCLVYLVRRSTSPPAVGIGVPSSA